MPPVRHDLLMPDLGLPEQSVTACLWLVEVGATVTIGDRLLEVAGGVATVDLPSPASGVLVETLVAEDDPLTPGQRLAVIEEAGEGTAD
jgi:2-oxoglutarate dehydrogenase E2 component (dihydrolipoamide succinyltransferase)